MQQIKQDEKVVISCQLALKKNDNIIRVLHVDDDQTILEVSKLILLDINSNLEIEFANSVEDGFRKLAQSNYDVIISDYDMPQKNGLDFLRGIKEKGLRIPFVLFTGKGREEIAIEALNLGADGYYNKQGNPETVYGELAHGIKTAYVREQAEKKIEQANSRYAQLFATMPDGVAVYEGVDNGENFVFKDLNPAAEKIEKIFKSLVIGKKVTEAFPGVEDFGLLKVLQKVWKTGEPEFFSEALYKDQRDPGSWRENWVYKFSSNEIVAIYKDITEIKIAQMELESKYETLEKVAGSIDSGLAIIGRDYKVVWANKTLTDLGFITNRKCYETINRPNFCPDCGVKKVFEENLPLDIHEYKTVGLEGQTTFVELRATPIKDKNGNVTSALELAIPITDRKKTEEKLWQNELRYNLIANNTHDVIWTMDLDGHFTYVSPSVFQLRGYTSEEAIKQSITEVLTPDSAQKIIEALQKFNIDNSLPSSNLIELEQTRKDGSTVWIEVSFSIVRNKNGEPESILGVSRDISERKTAEDKLRQSEKEFKALFSSMTEGVCLHEIVRDKEGKAVDYRILNSNPAYERLTGLKSQEAAGKLASDLYGTSQPPYLEIYDKVAETGENVSFETYFPPMNKHFSIEVFSPSKGKFATVFSDITESKKTREQIVNSHMELEVVNEKLQVVGSLTRHDLRNKLSVIKNLVYLMQKNMGETQKLEDYLSKISTEVDRVNQFLEFGGLYEKAGTELIQNIDVGVAFQDATKFFSSLKNVKIVNKCRGLMVKADSLFMRVLFNLLQNSLRHGEKVALVNLYYEETIESLNLYYEDDGVGVNQENKMKIFEGFTTNGTGVGLRLVRKVIEGYGWSIAEIGKKGEGAKFVMTIPKESVISSEECHSRNGTQN